MTADEATAVCKIMLNADGGCCVCAKNLCREFAADFPEHAAVARKVYEDSYGESDWEEEEA